MATSAPDKNYGTSKRRGSTKYLLLTGSCKFSGNAEMRFAMLFGGGVGDSQEIPYL